MKITIIATFLLALFAETAGAALSNAETIAALAGRIIGAAKACGVDAGRLTRAAETIFKVVEARAVDEDDNGRAIVLFPTTFNAGVGEVSSGRTTCGQARDAFDQLERQFQINALPRRPPPTALRAAPESDFAAVLESVRRLKAAAPSPVAPPR